ncbi:HXXXD-type acyl-transferase family protein [Perilla frutescens var. hirtella]|uniref:HXXXD-type acyl-transferase family protein n=1 Tax=Perilla frutescens var. hirtella TaxID=608512 RepID=A0AAD4J5F3_PERFH|nr:HXXXD-type acyl-transferase family protein [Perilla frutescens var. hirtella]
MASTDSLTFKVTRKSPVLIPPAKPTPHELRFLSDIDDQYGLRFQMPLIEIYRNNPSMRGKDPVRTIRDAVAKALVFYYPFAGRLREYATRKLVVECTGEGVVFVEADADVSLQQLGTLVPPIPNLQELLHDVPGTAGVINSPLMLIQVTRLICGGFIFAFRYSHAMSDATGILQFLTAVGELARGAECLSVPPVWERHILCARYPPRVTLRHREYDVVIDPKGTLIAHDRVVRHLFFGSAEISALRRSLPPHLQHSCSRFELVTACMWRCRTSATSTEAKEEVRLLCVVNIRKRLNPPLPEGYYGNAIVYPAAVTSADKLLKNPLQYAVELVKKAKHEATEEYVKSVVDLMVVRGRPDLTGVRTYLVSYAKGFDEVDVGWGKAAYGGVARAGVDSFPRAVSYFMPYKNDKGEDGILVPICLPPKPMELFINELHKMMVRGRSSIASPL